MKKGFTLIELVISLTIFMAFLSLAAGSYVSVAKGSREANQAQRVYRDVRHVFDTLAAEIRSSSIDFSCIDPSRLDAPAECTPNRQSSHQTVLLLYKKTADGERRTYFKFDQKTLLQYIQTRRGSFDSWTTIAAWQPLLGNDVRFDDAYFTVTPLRDPYAQINARNDAIQWQPSVGITISIPPAAFTTTYSSRFYGRSPLYQE